MRTIQQELALIGREVSKKGGDKSKQGVWADLLELWVRMREREHPGGERGPWEQHCIEQAARSMEQLRKQEVLSWGLLQGGYDALRLLYAPHRGRHVPTVRQRIQRLNPEPEQLRALATRLGQPCARLVRWLEGEPDRRCDELASNWLMRGEQEFPDAVHPRVEELRERRAQKATKFKESIRAPLLE